MIKKLRKIASIAAVIALVATGPVVAQVWSQAANALTYTPPNLSQTYDLSNKASYYEKIAAEIVNKAILLFGVDLPFGHVTQTSRHPITHFRTECNPVGKGEVRFARECETIPSA